MNKDIYLYITKFVDEVCEYLDVDKDKIEISYDPTEAAEMTSLFCI